ncbi:transcription accessory protein [Marinobacterium nitratireducens]|uniref:Transcription accessory protein n=1 Tax=Marinobacterium nitratireducens TaxID=518897 RepID=A0A918DYB9_9GAMM|nr:Tex family protein [Marinobacterium nitratireducens]GGO87871.1 transcription accessory protein [Marinobacterium nitratireducens]
MHIEQLIAGELGARPQQVNAAIRLLDEGASVPFIARYRKEVTGALDDGQLRTLEQRLGYLRELEDRRQVVLESIREQGKLDAALERSILDADTKNRLEDLYLPFRPKRRTRAQKAREAGLEPLADQLQAARDGRSPQQQAAEFLNPGAGVENAEQALEGARQILIERFAESADLLESLRIWLWQQGELRVSLVKGKESEGQKFRDYFDYGERCARIPSHRALAILRGQQEGVLRYRLSAPEGRETEGPQRIARHWRLPADAWLDETARQCWSQKLLPGIESDLVRRLRGDAEEEAIRVFARNLRDLLLAAPAGPRATLGLDPGLRTGVKVAVVDATGKLLAHETLYPHAPHKRWDQALATLSKLCRRYRVELVAIGNGTASRETEQLARELAAREPELGLVPVVVSEAGASVYSASELAAAEFPQLDVTIRGAVSIARRLQDPLAELVKIEPKSIGVGQYQHDVDQNALAAMLGNVVEDCVNHVGVDLNTASAELLSQVAGLSRTVASNIVDFRNSQGAFSNRRQLLKVPRLGPKAFEQCAGFLRIRDGEQPLDNSAVHPEAYALVERMAAQLGCTLADLIGDRDRLARLDLSALRSERFGDYTLTDIVRELEKPGRDPRPEFRTARFDDSVTTLADLKPGQWLEGAVTNVTNFGAFVDIGVHQDGLVHISELADRFVKDPHEHVSTGQVVRVRVLSVDSDRKRIALSMKSENGKPQPRKEPQAPAREGTLAAQLRAAGVRKR